MFDRDLLIAIVAFVLGAFVMHAAYISRPACFEFWLVKRIEGKLGRPKTRAVVGLTGFLIAMLGVYVLAFPSSTYRSSISPDAGHPTPLTGRSTAESQIC